MKDAEGLGRERLAIAAAYLLMALAARPWGEFPLNDDWDFTAAAWNFARTGELEFTRYTAATVKLQVLWGALWTWLFGESHHVLRLSTMALAIGVLLAVHDFLARLGAGVTPRLVGSMAVLVNPLFFWSSLTFMTQVPYLFCSVLAMRAFALALMGRGNGTAGGVWALASSFIRQTGVANAAAAAAAALFAPTLPRRARLRVATAAVVTVAVFAVLFLTTSAFVSSGAEFEKHAVFGAPDWTRRIAWNLVEFAAHNVRNAGLAFLPLAVVLLFPAKTRFSTQQGVVGILALGVLLVSPSLANYNSGSIPSWALIPEPTPQFGQVLTNPGLGPLTVPDVSRMGNSAPFGLSVTARTAIGFGSAILGALLVAGLASPRLRTVQPVFGLLVWHMVAATAALAVSVFYFDRYSLDSMWGLAVLIPLLVEWDRRKVVGAVVALAVVGLYSVTATAGYFSWNRARWAVAEELVRQGVEPEAIDAGYEWNAMVRVWPGRPALGREILPRPDAPYLVAFAPVDGYRVVARAPWSMWFIQKEMLALEALRGRSPQVREERGGASAVGQLK